ncbi:MAG: type II toxin-antitoxin system VapC family toxin [Hadesarchaea archaeon]|nr:type II toxin-antitoxin system VapC family toxin [Hadesarchaea archaeon]
MRKDLEEFYVDSNVFIYAAVYDEKGRGGAAKKILSRMAKGEIGACTSSLTWDELVWVVRRIEGWDAAYEEGAKFLQLPNLKILSVDGVVDLAQKLIENYDIGPRDAIHAACALKNGVREIISDDRGLDRIKEVKRIPLEKAAAG